MMNNELSPLGIDTAIRLRLLCQMIGLLDAVPSDNNELMACQFVVFGQMRRKIEELKSMATPILTNEIDGATIPKDGGIAKWLASEEGQAAIKKSLSDSAQTIATLNEARKVSFDQLNTPMGSGITQAQLRLHADAISEAKKL